MSAIHPSHAETVQAYRNGSLDREIENAKEHCSEEVKKSVIWIAIDSSIVGIAAAIFTSLSMGLAIGAAMFLTAYLVYDVTQGYAANSHRAISQALDTEEFVVFAKENDLLHPVNVQYAHRLYRKKLVHGYCDVPGVWRREYRY